MQMRGVWEAGMALIRWIIVFLIFALLASLFGFSGAASGFSEIAKVLLFVFVVLLIISLFFGGRSRSGP
ncbi:DUF1328 domain-containing protein [Acetobacter okinawensis]